MSLPQPFLEQQMFMTSKKIFQNIKYVIIGTVLAVGLSYIAHAATFTAPTGIPPANNTATPLNVGTTDQIKQGGLSVATFIANANAELDGNTFFGGVLHADPTNSTATISFGGMDPKSVERKVALAITGGFGNTGSIASTPLSNTTMSTVCADANGDVILCAVSAVCSNIPAATTIPAGDTRNADGTCSVQPKRFLSIRTSATDVPVSYSNFTGHIVNGNVTYQQPLTQSMKRPMLPYLETIGLDNDFPNGWVIDTISGIQGTTLTNGNNRLLTVDEKGSYDIKISAQGQIGIKGKFNGDNNIIAASFYMVVNKGQSTEQWIPLSNIFTGKATINPSESTTNVGKRPYNEPYPISNQQIINVVSENGAPGSNGDDQDQGKIFAYAPYNFSFEKALQLNPGDTIDLYTFSYGGSYDTGLFGNINAIGSGPNNFTWYMDTTDSTFDITETP